MSHTVYATFLRPEEAERAAGALLTQGVRPEDISVVKQPGSGVTAAVEPRATASNVLLSESQFPTAAPRTGEGSVYGVEPDPTDVTVARADVANGDDTVDEGDVQETLSDVPPEAVAGAKKGGLIGAGVGVVAAIAALAIPGVGFVLGAGALASAIAGVAATAGAGAAAGAIVGYLKDHGVDDDVAQDYAETVDRGGAVLAVTLPSGPVSEEQGNAILEEYRAMNVNRYAARTYVA